MKIGRSLHTLTLIVMSVLFCVIIKCHNQLSNKLIYQCAHFGEILMLGRFCQIMNLPPCLVDEVTIKQSFLYISAMEEMVYTDSFSFKVKPVNLEENKEKKNSTCAWHRLEKKREIFS